MLRNFFIVAACTLFIAPFAQAQDTSLLGAGTRVKLVTPALEEAQQIGTVVSATRDTITFRADIYPVTRTFAVSDITAFEVSGGKQTHRGRDALFGFAIGGGVGALVGVASYKKQDPNGCFIFCETRSGDAIGGGVLGGLAGTVIGAFIVGSLDKTERWIPLRKTASIFIAPTRGGAQLALSAHF